MAHAAGCGAAMWCMWLREAQRHGACGHKRGQQCSVHSWVGCSDMAHAAMRGGGDVACVAMRGAATWCAQLGGVQQHGMCGCGRCGDAVCVATRGGSDVARAAGWGSATMWPMQLQDVRRRGKVAGVARRGTMTRHMQLGGVWWRGPYG
jgi:hypothetical protein